MEYREWDMYDYILESKAAVKKNLSRFIFWDLEPVITHL